MSKNVSKAPALNFMTVRLVLFENFKLLQDNFFGGGGADFGFESE